MALTTKLALDESVVLDMFDEAVDPATFARGLAYARQGRATVLNVHDDAGEIEIDGVCLGSQGQEYAVSVWLDANNESEAFVADSVCGCPVERDCKHAVALLLTFSAKAAEGTRILEQELGFDKDTIRPETQEWLKLLDDAGNPVPDSQTLQQPCIVYVFKPGSPPTLTLGKSKPLKKGGLSKPQRFTLQSTDLSPRLRRDFVAEDDETPLRLYQAALTGSNSYYYQSYDPEARLIGETGALLLMRAAQTGRLFLINDMHKPLAIDNGRMLELKWLTDAQGKQQLRIAAPARLQILPVWPIHFYDPDAHCIGELRSELPPGLLKALIVAPALNEHEAIVVRARLDALTKRIDNPTSIPLPEALSPQQPSAPPRATLRLGMGRFRHTAMSALDDPYPIAELSFDYAEGVRVTGTATPEPLVQISRPEGSLLMQRDLASELAVWQQLQAAGLESHTRRLPSYERLDGDGDCLLAGPSDERGWLPFLEHQLPLLEASGIRVVIGDDFPFDLSRAEEWFVEIDEESSSDWFELDLGVVIEGERISLVPPLLGLLKTQPKLLARLAQLADTDTLPVRLDARRILPVPVPRLRAWLAPLLEFLDEDRPRLSRHHAGTLASLGDETTRWLGGEALRTLGEKLRNFAGIADTPPDPGFRATLRPYQQAGLSWLQFLRSFGLAGILADDMGLGKTVQTLAHLQLEKTSGRADRPSLVIAPTSLLPNWANEAAQFAPDLRVIRLHGPERSQHFDKLAEADLILTTYPLLVRDHEVLLKHDYHLLVLDEAQFIKNPKAQSHQFARKLKARHRLSLTGTPLENHLGELWAQFDFLMPGFLGGSKRFNEVFRSPIEKEDDNDARTRLAARVAPFMLRRTRDQVLNELPARTEIVRWVELAGGQRDLYESLRVAFDRKLREALVSQGVGRSQIMILDALLKLRQACCDPRLVKLESAQKVAPRGIAESAKLTDLMELIDELVDEGRRILLFSQFTSMLELIEAELKKRKLSFTKLTGNTRDRDKPVREFQEGRIAVFMISLKAGGTGLNLTAADTVIHYDPWWNPAVEEQATARAHRLGQDKPVFVYKLLGRGTVEEKILALQDRKRGLADQLLSGSKDGDGGHLITAEDLDVLFQPLDAA